jgi:dTDP-4-dehydrorhamnose reductase
MIKKIWITGASGQLGLSLRDVFYYMPYELVLTDIVESDGVTKVDIAEPGEIVGLFYPETRPDLIVNTAAMTNVDACETDPEAADRANFVGPWALSSFSRALGIPLLHISTDFIFNGRGATPYRERDTASPESVYGLSKLKGENTIMVSGCDYWILRTAWLYSEFGRNFVKTMIDLGRKLDLVKVVNDQIGSPTYARDLATAILDFVEYTNAGDPPPFGVYHFANAGQASWYDLAKRSVDMSGSRTPVVPQTFEEYKRSQPSRVIAPRPAFSVLDTSKIAKVLGYAPRHWVDAHMDCITSINNLELDNLELD